MRNLQSEYQKVVNYIIEMIQDGRLIVGSKLPSERELSETLSLGRNSAREAISILRGLGLVESRHGSGNYIAARCDDAIRAIVTTMLALGNITRTDINEYRTGITLAVSSLLIEKGFADEDIQRFEEILTGMEHASREEFIELDKAFHLGLISATKNPLYEVVMLPIGEIYLSLIHELIMNVDDEQKNEIAAIHRAIFESIRSRDKAACKAAMARHYSYRVRQ